MPNARQHWDRTYTTKPETGVSWYQTDPAISFRLITSAAPDRASPIVDVGGGASRLVDRLLGAGYSDLTVLDISDAALLRSKARLEGLSAHVQWIVSDVTEWRSPRRFAVWHDRAVFHFQTDHESQSAYIAALTMATAPGSAVIIATFAPTGPERCSGLPVQRYSPAALADRLGTDFQLTDDVAERHQTPFGTTQDFVYCAFRRR